MRRYMHAARPGLSVGRPTIGDIVLAVTAATVQTFTGTLFDGGWHQPDLARVSIGLAAALALIWRRQHPVFTLFAAVTLDALLLAFPPTSQWLPIASLIALYTLTSHLDRWAGWTVGICTASLLGLASLMWQTGGGPTVVHLVPFDFAIIAVAIGDATRSRRGLVEQLKARAVQAESTKETAAARRVRDERVRIARDLHDDVAHHIVLVNAQAGVARYLMSADPEKAHDALGQIEDNSRRALEEIRATVMLLKDGDEPAPLEPRRSFGERDSLIESFRSAGMEVSYAEEGLYVHRNEAVDLTAYRILQEGLTNAGKHSTRAIVDVRLKFTGDELHLKLVNDHNASRRGSGTGLGLIGVRERAQSVGGWTTTQVSDGRFTLHAVLPLSGGTS
ncbi:signal transduction histidine kinase [Williamsia limnetica]|uniref:histidine kinase n=1 Tax=Williamsia limnetica TaxID=882452 RepID=A0A318RHT6_WILLI|nr:histidine kinase [Williamsia limnetica]PYE14331.1 signal transduction histidine kinase [Williamsia limnetica]